MKHALLAIPALISGLCAAQAETLPLGNWARGDGNATVRIAPCGESLCAINTSIKDTSSGEAVGDKLVMNVKPKRSGVLAGDAYDAKRERNYAITIKYSENTMSTRGCIVQVLCKTVNWSRIR